MDVRCDGVENRGVKVDGVKQRSGWWAEWQGARILVCTPVPPLSYPLSWAMRNKSRPETAAILLRLLPQRGQLSAARLASFTPLILQACRLHTTCPGSPHASHHTSCELHNTRPASPQASHHMSCMLHTTRPGSRFCFTPPVLQACMLHTIRPASFTPHVL